MRRLFISLYLSIAFAVALLLFGLPMLVEAIFEPQLISAVSGVAKAPQKLFETELQAVPQAQWAEHIAGLQSKFGYKIELVELADVDASKAVIDRLRRGDAASTLNDDPDLVYLPIRGSSSVVSVHFSETETEQIERTIVGFFYLLEKHMRAMTPEERDSHLAAITAQNDFPIFRASLASLELTSLERTRLAQGDAVGRDFDGNDEVYFKLESDGQTAIVIGPIRTPWLMEYTNQVALGVLALVFGVVTFFWLRPLWLDMLALDRGAVALGEGNLEARVSVSKRSPIRRLVSTFNAMAKRIARLVGAHKSLVDSVSHELRTPIARLRFGLEGVTDATSDAQRDRFATGMRQDIDELDQLVDELLTFSRLDHSSPVINLETVSIHRWLGQRLESFELIRGDIALDHSVADELDEVSMDPRLMARALNNLVRNALRYAQTQVVVSVISVNGAVELQVDDDGPGIAVADRHRVFEPFARLDVGREENGGYGLGLAIVKRICDWHNAQIAVTDSPLGGARFSLRW